MNKQSGNALWFILIAIGLLGLLTVSLTRSGSSTNETGSYEQNQIVASEILTYAKSIENAVQSLLARGCSENEISFENAVVSGYSNANSPTDNSCHVFEPEGAGMTYTVPKEKWLDSSQSSEALYQELYIHPGVCIKEIGNGSHGCHGDGIQNEDMTLFIPYLKLEICEAINRELGWTNIPQDTDNAWRATPVKFTGTFSDDFLLGNPPIESMMGEDNLCFEGDDTPATGTYHFYHVLHAR